ncbi:MAG: hypothetical protein ACREQV_22675 [Candidatus Binatia bacterium]
MPQADKWWSPYPSRSSTNFDALGLPEQVTAEDGFIDQVIYIKKERDGEIIDHFLMPTYSSTDAREIAGSAIIPLNFRFDDRVYEDYARLLPPRAVGYSAGLLDYFFRGRLKAELRRVEGMPRSYPPFCYAEPPYTVQLRVTNP